MAPIAMSSGGEYDKGSRNQALANQGAEVWLKTAAAAACRISPGPIQILDLGCATGQNSARELRSAVQAVRDSEIGGDKEIVITHIDTSLNDWSQLCQTVTSSADSYLTVDRTGVYSHASAKSFYDQVAPTASVAIVYSGVAFHWLSTSKPVSDGVLGPKTADKAAYEWNTQQAARDWHELLKMRAREMLPGGYLIATAITLKGSERLADTFFWAWEGFLKAMQQGLISTQELSSFAYGSHWRSREEWLAPFEGELSGVFEVMEFSENVLVDPNWTEYQAYSRPESERRQALADAYWTSVSAIAGGLLKAHLMHRSTADVERVLEVIRQHYVHVVASDPSELIMPFAFIVLRRK